MAAQDNSAGLATMLSFLQQGQGSGADPLPQMPDYSSISLPTAPQQPQHQGIGIGGMVKSIAGNTLSGLLSAYVGDKLQKHIDKGTAEETSAAYAPVLQKMRDSATNPQDKAFYDTHLESLKSNNPTLVNNTMESVKARILEASKLTPKERELQNPELRLGALREANTQGMSNTEKEMTVVHPELQPGTQEYNDAFMQLKRAGGINMGNELPPPAQGYMWDKAGSAQVAIPGGPADQTTKPLTDFQGKASSFSSRMSDAHKTLLETEDLINVPQLSTKQWAEQLPMVGPAAGAFFNKQLSATQQQVDRAQRGFVNALLRHDSGATINPDEFDNYKKEYFPATGDAPEVIADKRAAREAAILKMDEEAGAGGKAWSQNHPNKGGQIPATKSSKAVNVPAPSKKSPLDDMSLEELKALADKRGLKY
jgi:hypothetical protein